MGERVELADARDYIGLAFEHWREQCGDDTFDLNTAEAEALAFLAQVEADRKQLDEALKACHVLAESINDKEVAMAKRMAREVIMSRGEHISQAGRIVRDPWAKDGSAD